MGVGGVCVRVRGWVGVGGRAGSAHEHAHACADSGRIASVACSGKERCGAGWKGLGRGWSSAPRRLRRCPALPPTPTGCQTQYLSPE